MDTSGRPREGWMTVVPVAVFTLFIVLALGGPVNFVNTLGIWAVDTTNALRLWVKSF